MDLFRFVGRSGFAFQDRAFVKVGRFREPVDRRINSDEPLRFDSKACFFQNFPYDRLFRRFVSLDPASRKDPDGDIPPLDQ